MENFLKLHRKMLNWGWYGDINTTRLFIHILLMANWLPGECYGIPYQAGEFITSLEKLSKETNLSISQVRTAIKHLEMTGEIASTSQGRCRVITVKNWDVYQVSDKDYRKRIARKSQDNRKEIATELDIKKEEKRIKNKYYEDSELDKAFADYCDMRKFIKKPMSDRAIELAKGKLDKLSNGDKETAIAILNQSIEHSWQGLFELKTDYTKQKPKYTDKFHNFKGRDYDYDELAREMMM